MAEHTTTFDVPVRCAACVLTLEGLEDRVPGVTRVDVSRRRQRVTITHHPDVTRAELDAALRELGHPPRLSLP